MIKLWHQSVAFRLALLCGVLVIISVTAFALVFYLGTIHSLERNVNRKLNTISRLLLLDYDKGGVTAVEKSVRYYLNDGVDFDTEVFLLAGPKGREIEGNVSATKALLSFPPDRFIDREVIRYGAPSRARLILHKLPNGDLLVVGRDLKNIDIIMQRLWRTMAVGGLIGLLIAFGGTFLFRCLLERRIGDIRRTVEAVQSGKLETRIPVSGSGDEFERLGAEMNRMFDKLEQLMHGIRHVSNTIAHNLRTPLGRVRASLDDALRNGADCEGIARTAEHAIDQVDGLIVTFDKLLQIAESESGAKHRAFEPVVLSDVVNTVVELYDAIAEEKGIALRTDIEGNPAILGDRHLLASLLANLTDNALKYGATVVTISMHTVQDKTTVTLAVQDNGPGIPAGERSKVIEPFYRLHPDIAGSGLGLSIVAAIARLHNASLLLEDAGPGLRVRVDLPLFVSS